MIKEHNGIKDIKERWSQQKQTTMKHTEKRTIRQQLYKV